MYNVRFLFLRCCHIFAGSRQVWFVSLDLIAYTLLCVLGCIDHDPATSPRSMVRLISAQQRRNKKRTYNQSQCKVSSYISWTDWLVLQGVKLASVRSGLCLWIWSRIHYCVCWVASTMTLLLVLARSHSNVYAIKSKDTNQTWRDPANMWQQRRNKKRTYWSRIHYCVCWVASTMTLLLVLARWFA
jgi:uncharacterized MAPEG superfamily protein